MKFFIKVLLASVFTLNVQSSFSDEVTVGDDGMYWKVYDSIRSTDLFYQVDTVAKVCLAIYQFNPGAGVTEISCDTLAKRPEWKGIINWTENNK